MNTLFDPSPELTNSRILLVALPGANDRAESFFSQGLVQALRARHLPIDVIGIDADFTAYADRTLIPAVEREIARVTRARDIERLWFVGTSLGGMGALICCDAYSASIEGTILIAPYLGSRRVLARVQKAGGLSQWRPGSDEPDELEWRSLDWVRRHVSVTPHAPRIYLGYGRDDPFSLSSELLEPLLPAGRTVVVDGGHDWATWSALWERILECAPFDADIRGTA
ncbi:alpha/beta hydrolase [Trinickia sp. Y13]|uniref:alpha/beta fold hydrolase n=1 Tax=Trinickia sp. Y13 TaxID=2917807 RepID=UPI0024070C35|nr:alpha/beta hydrolase [Trinickia sp. Y13]MDG0025362.1 alpha/beta hydrolase [Trinickia sp. Y13]